MKEQPQRLPPREQYRALVSLLIIPLGLIIIVRASLVGVQAWPLLALGLVFVALAVVRLRAYAHYKGMLGTTPGKRKRT